MMTSLRKLIDFGSDPTTSQMIRPTDLTKFELPPPVVITDEPLSDQFSSPPTEAKKKSEITCPLEYQDEQRFRGEEFSIYYDAREYISDDDTVEDDTEEPYTLPVLIYTSQHKSLRRGPQWHDSNSFTSQWLSGYPSSGCHLSRQASTRTMDSACWSVRTVYTYNDLSDHSNEATLVPDVSEEVKGETSGHSEYTLSKPSTLSSLRDLAPDTRSRRKIFAKGVPWGFHGRDYLPPSLKCHSLRKTMRGDRVNPEHVVPFLIIKVKNLFRKRKRLDK
jgi:hypothetical protein